MTRNLYYTISMVLALYVHMVYTNHVEQCGQTYLSPKGLTCLYCAPGTYKAQDCRTNLTGALCKTCPMDTYQSNCNRAESCEPCNPRCKVQYKKVKNCTLYENIICECKEGYFRFQETPTDEVCLPYKHCEVGYGMVNPGNPYNDTECKECDNGTYSSTVSLERCNPCTKCEIYKTPCTATRDAECQVAWTNTTDRPTQTTERNNNSSTADMSTQTVECNDDLKAPLIVSAVVNVILISALICAAVIRMRQQLWKTFPCCDGSQSFPDYKLGSTQEGQNSTEENSGRGGSRTPDQQNKNRHPLLNKVNSDAKPSSSTPLLDNKSADDTSNSDGSVPTNSGQDAKKTLPARKASICTQKVFSSDVDYAPTVDMKDSVVSLKRHSSQQNGQS